ncbi:5-methyltetrahydrofolate--homocysteine S-methyltransferase and 5,10-methylenetetrahydrofolate reductase [Citrifermentans bemidjiense Bem]|uniref:5-methyltetrahydrofolate--homocysteine S-methyltransferase and 5,10-methylenetetrahydrofolate reductase n=1 Tax=Citrifermentans bemidjiense (strain ATCC BAA-1014 / DSM 16622 / JCM 12645 / Bem) TaxID=404380 RepID=B5ED55_CITBB|nr:bifunctional homocysteine S-methyltransferase/methylenetetrahydrofolate reductase [Citrifermentans bemidjiense]ACH37641.1 5-methyltetrahydrofolate--homocysteine S-methyltransferase and 5,10-methylenetetrahydrofolate reductase [Citrifermentans bemidjiense Bem]
MGGSFLERVAHEVLIGDGAIGTMLYAKGVALDANFEHLNLVRPQLVLDLHAEYLAAGAQVIETNTFGANYAKLSAIGIGGKVADINRQGAILARRAAKVRDVFVAGSMGPMGRGKQEMSADQVRDSFRLQAAALAEGGVDLLILETFSELDELETALSAARETGLPVVANLAFGEGSRLAGGIEAEDAALRLAAAGASLVGANCGAGPLELLATLKRIAAVTDLPLAAYPNSGFPEYVDGRYIYRTTPDYFAARAEEMVAAGAVLVGGCCGTTPEHIRVMAQRLKGARPAARVAVGAVSRTPASEKAKTAASGFLDLWGKEMVVTVELDPPKGLDCSRILAGSRALKEAGADAINLAENPLARVRMGNLALASLIRRDVGIEVIAHITCRDRNLIGLQSDLMGASLLGVSSILAVTGDPASLGEEAGASSVFDLNSFTLIKLLSDLNRGVNALGNPIGAGTGFTIGAAFNPNTQKMEVQVARLAKKVANGACFAQTQPIYDLERFEQMMEQTAHLGIPILPGVLPLVSGRNAEFLHNEVPGITIPDGIRARMAGKTGEEGVREGLAIAREFIEATMGRVGGFYLIPPFGKYEIAVELVKFIKSRAEHRGH